ncbi:unnamed protein product [Polarella glacialis]|uniref:Uncharacterized protein n=1 Tax=Polarella glacialis TaxID=89957 RepID=A0A813DE78_POLGL|nr:unnamed protein product [Polarella glacialis]
MPSLGMPGGHFKMLFAPRESTMGIFESACIFKSACIAVIIFHMAHEVHHGSNSLCVRAPAFWYTSAANILFCAIIAPESEKPGYQYIPPNASSRQAFVRISCFGPFSPYPIFMSALVRTALGQSVTCCCCCCCSCCCCCCCYCLLLLLLLLLLCVQRSASGPVDSRV